MNPPLIENGDLVCNIYALIVTFAQMSVATSAHARVLRAQKNPRP